MSQFAWGSQFTPLFRKDHRWRTLSLSVGRYTPPISMKPSTEETLCLFLIYKIPAILYEHLLSFLITCRVLFIWSSPGTAKDCLLEVGGFLGALTVPLFQHLIQPGDVPYLSVSLGPSLSHTVFLLFLISAVFPYSN